jgi:spore coat polysaccharide biosynthesis protein SpsF
MTRRPRVCATIEARMTSSRLPGKVLMDCLGEPFLARQIERLKRVERLDDIVIATTVNRDDDPVVALAERLDVKHYRGSELDVMSRILEAAEAHEAEVIVQTTGDCPVIDRKIIGRALDVFLGHDVDFVSNVTPPTFPDGMDVRIFRTSALRDAFGKTDSPFHHEHGSTWFYQGPEIYRLINIAAPPGQDRPDLFLTLDYAEDAALIRAIYGELFPRKPDFDLGDIMSLLRRRPELIRLNADVRKR